MRLHYKKAVTCAPCTILLKNVKNNNNNNKKKQLSTAETNTFREVE